MSAARLSRRGLTAGALAAAIGGQARSTRGHGELLGAAAASVADLAVEMLPPADLGQADVQVFIPETGHTLRGVMLDYWRANGAASVYGHPISEPFASPDGYYSQAFENAIFQYRPELLWTDEPIVRLLPIGPSFVTARAGDVRLDGRRIGGGGDPRTDVWRALAPDSDAVARVIAEGGRFFAETGYTLAGDFLGWWAVHEGPFYLGAPVSQELGEGARTVQYFQGGALERHEDGVHLVPVGHEIAALLEVDTSPVPRGDLPLFDEASFATAANPFDPAWNPYAAGRKRFEVSIAEQMLWAFQGDDLVLQSLVSTGLSPNDTEVGRFHVRLKYPEQDMQGFTDATGEVIDVGEVEGQPAGGERYQVDDVPNVMYFNLDAEALHGTYWHNNFGQKMSHGCVNLPLDVAAFLFGWAPLGTEVLVYE